MLLIKSMHEILEKLNSITRSLDIHIFLQLACKMESSIFHLYPLCDVFATSDFIQADVTYNENTEYYICTGHGLLYICCYCVYAAYAYECHYWLM